APSDVPDGLTEGGLKVDTNSLTAGWLNAKDPTQTVANGHTTVDIQQTADKAILNWETFNVGRNTTVDFKQNADWAVLNRVNDPNARPSQILGQIKGDGTVMIVNRNGVVFDGTSQVNTRNLVAAAANISNTQFQNNGIYGADANTASLTDALGKVEVKAGARITTHESKSVTQGGGYVLLAGSEVHNTGEITTRKGQTQLAAGDSFLIRKGVGTDANTASTTRGNEISPRFVADSTAGKVSNSGLILSREGDITLAGRDVRQDGTAISTTTVNTRGTVHLLNAASDTLGKVTLGKDAITAVVLEDDGKTTALDSQRDALIKESTEKDLLRSQSASGAFDNLSILADRRDQSRIEIVSGGNVVFEGDSLTLATGGQIVSDAQGRSFVTDKAQLDVAGAVGVTVAMESNNVKVNVQGNELRDSPLNRDSGKLFNNDVWMDRRQLVLVPKGTGGYESDRWYTANGLLEVGGYLSNQGHGIGEWAAQGGTVLLGGSEVVTQAGSSVNLAGGTLDVQTGFINQTWLRGSDGRLYNLDKAPADMTFNGVYKGFESDHERWKVTEFFYNPLIGPQRRLENGYTVGRDAGQLIISTSSALLEGDIVADVFNGARQSRARDALADGYRQAQTAVAQAGGLSLGLYNGLGRSGAYAGDLTIGDFAGVPAEAGRLDAAWLNAQGLGRLSLAASGAIALTSDLLLADGGAIEFIAPHINLNADVTARGGSLSATNLLTVHEMVGGEVQTLTRQLLQSDASLISVGAPDRNVMLDLRGRWVNADLDPLATEKLARLNGGSVQLVGTGDVTLVSGSVIDVSSGGAVLTNGKTRGGTGGSVSLRAGESYGNSIGAGTLTLDGEVRGYGVNGGGTLQLQTGGSWVIGGKVLEVDGQLGAGEVALIDLELDQTLQLQSGEISPVNLVLEKTRFAAGERLDRDVRWQTLYGNAYSVPGGFQVGAAGWTLPPTMSVIAGGVTYSGSSTDPARRTVPAGSNITQIPSGASLPLGYVIATDVLPGGLPVLPYKYLLPAGSVVPADASVASLTLNPGQRLPAGTVFGQALAVRSPGTLVIDTPDAFGNSLLERGFSRYDINATHGLAVVGETTLAPRVPTLQFLGNAKAALNGDAGYEQALGLTLSPLFSEDPIKAKLTQRAGADLVLRSGLPRLSESSLIADLGSLYVGADARVSVDPGRDVLLESYGQITIEGHIEAPAGNIAVLNPRKHMDLGPGSLSIWIGERAVLDAAGRAQIAIDGRGRQYGLVLDGGHITLGSRGGLTTISGERPSSDAFVVVRPGALLDVSGAIGSVDESFILESGRIPAGSGVTRLVASHGGEIAMRSYNGIYLDGTLRGAGGGAGSAGGSLIVELESPVYGFPTSASGFPLPTFVPNHLRTARVLNVTQDVPGDRLAPTLGAGQYSSTLAVGHAGVGAAQIEAGGFDSAALSSRDVIAFNGAVALSVGGSLTLGQGKLVNTVEGAQVHLSAPYVLMDGHTAFTLQMPSNELFPTLGPDYARGGSLRIDGGLIDVRNRVAAEFDDLTLTSGSDLRFLAGTDTADYLPTRFTALANVGDLTLLAGQIYPASHAFVKVYAGVTMDLQTSAVDRVALSTLTIGRSDGAAGPLPYSVFGDITLAAAHIVQGGIVRAPLGSITLEGNGLIRLPDIPDFHFPTRVELLPGSITSVSAAGLLIPYGGTTDGVRYTIDGLAEGKEVPTFNVITGEREDTLAGGSTGVLTTGITLVASNVVSHDGSLVDLSGGGKLAGAAFVSGRGGSVDTLLYPRQKGGEVYALLPGTVTAPVAGSYYDSWKGSVPGIGQQVIVPEGVAGLPAGAYTLLPANYALLPGAYRVELGAQGAATSSRATATPDGSYVFNAATAIAGTAMHDAFARLVTLTPADVVRTWSQYNETSYADFQLAKAALTGAARPLLEDDGRFLELTLRGMTSIQDGGEATSEEPALVFDGLADFKAAKGGYGGTLLLTGEANNSSGDSLLVTGPGGPTTRSAAYWDGMQWAANAVTPIAAEAINAIGAPNLYIGGRPTRSGQFQKGSIVAVGKGGFEAITLTQGAVLQAGQIFLGTNDRSDTHRIVLEAGAGLSTLGWPASAPDSLLGVQFQIAGLVASNGWIDLAPLSGDIYSGTGLNSITLHDGAFLYADGTVGFTAKAIDIQGVPRLGARYLALSSSAFNVGNAETLAAARQGAAALAGLDLEQGFLAKLLRGDPVSGAPAVERLTFTAQNSFNFLGSVALDTYDSATGVSLLDEFIINSPAIYGLGTAQDAATLRTDTLIWKSNTRTIFDANYVASEVGLAPGAVNAGGPGTGLGTLDIQAREIVLGYPKVAAARNEIDFDRLALGFSTVNLAASDRIITTHRGNLSVYQSGPSPDTDFDAATYAGAGGTLNLIAPTVTGAAGSNFTYRVGGALNVRAPADAPASRDVTGELGAIINLMADRIDVSTAVVLPSGRLTMNAAHDITLSDGARIDMTGQRIDFFDTSRYSWGGELVAESAHGSIIQSEGASIDVSAKNSDAGRLQFTATNAAAGRVLLNGTLAGAGGASHEGGAIDIRAQRIGENSANLTGDFAALNSRLNGSGFSGSRSFALKQGNLSIGNELRAREVNVSVDGGSLTVNGTIDASGAKPGTIRLAARDDLTLAATSVLDAHGTQLQVDSYGQAIEAKNRGHVELTSSQGWLHLASGAKLDLSSPDGVERGKIELNTGRTGETSGDARIDASGPLDIEGAQSIALNAFWKYSPTDAAGTIVQNNGSGDVVNSTGAVGLDQIDTRSVQFMDAALGNTSLVTRTSGLSGYGKAYHLRPGVEINSEQTPSGDLTVVGDLDLSKYRYGRDADRDPSSTAYGAGEPLALAIRAAGDLTIRGSISDGFGSTVGTPPTYGVIASVAADPTGNFYNRGITYQLTVGRTVLLNRDWTVPSTWGLNSSSFPRDVAGRIYSAGEVIPAGTQLDRVVIRPQGNASEVSSLFSGITDPGTPTYFGTSPLAPMLAAGNRSASIRLSSGADLEAADKRSLQSSSALFGAGLLLLDRPQQQQDGSPMPSVIRTGTGDLEILAGGSLRQDSLFGIYTAGTQIAPDSGITTKPQTYIADHGGDLRIAAQSDLAGYV
ncbi:filamentous hemagglutinin N-terminal domain-containing protein, partial [Variovorax sp.]|uniref:two-partner secretion domain-containing protein n=1 Tax=Variovorax sp. TaxID=1871043 RepID=UPI0037DA5503